MNAAYGGPRLLKGFHSLGSHPSNRQEPQDSFLHGLLLCGAAHIQYSLGF